MDDIADKVNFGIIPSGSTEYLYAEETFSGLHAIIENTDESYSKVDMELLFNAIISHSEQLIKILNN